MEINYKEPYPNRDNIQKKQIKKVQEIRERESAGGGRGGAGMLAEKSVRREGVAERGRERVLQQRNRTRERERGIEIYLSIW